MGLAKSELHHTEKDRIASSVISQDVGVMGAELPKAIGVDPTISQNGQNR
jgi:hypothetical protein